MQLIHPHRETPRGHHHDVGQQRSAIGHEQLIECAPQLIVFEVLHLPGADAEQPRSKPLQNILMPIDRLTLHDNRADQNAQPFRVRQSAPPVLSGHETFERLLKAELLHEVVDQRQRPEPFTDQIERWRKRRSFRLTTHDIWR